MERVERCSPSCAVCGLVPLAPGRRRGSQIVAESPAMQDVLKRAARFAQADAPVVILGETGAGQEVVARTLHGNSPRRSRRFVAVNVAALPADLLESELFGHAKGAFTGAAAAKAGLFEAASGGTLFLDEVAELPLLLQAKLLRALQDGEIRRVGETRSFTVDVRIVSATHRDLAAAVQAGTFREDLYYRLKVLTLRVPPLRERRKDVLPLACIFLHEEARQLHGFSPGARERLLAYPWPGNVRELHNAVMHGAALARGSELDVDDLPEELAARADPHAGTGDVRPLAEVEREHVLRVLDACGGSQTEAARRLGIGRNTLWRKVRSYA
ncbi:MAG: sigma-54-dependent Fis family transcriptional regulator [Polyangiaceae bacterium]|nr:sigma-54-dependent Fis family transcriptional regulator [Polyangiaceae bacterium]